MVVSSFTEIRWAYTKDFRVWLDTSFFNLESLMDSVGLSEYAQMIRILWTNEKKNYWLTFESSKKVFWNGLIASVPFFLFEN